MWEINAKAYDRWVKGRTKALEPTVSIKKPSVRALVAAALLEKPEGCSYDGINQTLRARGVLRNDRNYKDIPVATLRVAVSELARALKKNGQYRLVNERLGRHSRLRLVRQRSMGTSLRGPFRPLPLPETEPREITNFYRKYRPFF